MFHTIELTWAVAVIVVPPNVAVCEYGPKLNGVGLSTHIQIGTPT